VRVKFTSDGVAEEGIDEGGVTKVGRCRLNL